MKIRESPMILILTNVIQYISNNIQEVLVDTLRNAVL